MGVLLKTWMKRLLPLLGYHTFCYVTIFSLYWMGVYPNLLQFHPIILIAYLALIEIFAGGVLAYALTNKPKFYLPFIIINAIFIVGLIIMIVLIFTDVFGVDGKTRIALESSPLHHLNLLSYLLTAMVLEGLCIAQLMDISKIQELPEVIKPVPGPLTTSSKESLKPEA